MLIICLPEGWFLPDYLVSKDMRYRSIILDRLSFFSFYLFIFSQYEIFVVLFLLFPSGNKEFLYFVRGLLHRQ